MSTTSNPDLLVIGGGIVGLWCAQRAMKLGLRTVVADKGQIGQGASGGFLGALMPHQPIHWNGKKAFQLEALLSLEEEISALEAETGKSCGYHRCGRLIPIQTERKLEQSRRWQAGAVENWPAHSPAGTQISLSVVAAPSASAWLDATAAPLGCDFDTLSARVNPRGLVSALQSQITTHATNPVTLLEHHDVAKVARDGMVTFTNGQTIAPKHIIVAAGWESFSLLTPLFGGVMGGGVKGQAALLKPKTPMPHDHPIIYRGGVYIIGHENGLVAVGSTSEKQFTQPGAVDEQVDDLIVQAEALCPALAGVDVVERWAGVRPQAIGRDPIIGLLPDADNVIIASGGFKITLGIAHRMADAAIGYVTGNPVRDDVPDGFSVSHHVSLLKS